MTAACIASLRASHAGFMTSVFPGGVTATAAVLLLFAILLAVAAAYFVLRRYGVQVRRLMLLEQIAAPPPAWLARQGRGRSPSTRAAPEPRPAGTASRADLEAAAAARLATVRRATWLAYAVFIAGSPVFLWAGRPVATGDIIGYCLAVPALGAVPALVNIQPQGSKRLVFGGMVVLGAVLAVLEPSTGDAGDALFVPVLFAALYLVTAHRKLRTVVVVMSAWFTAVLAGIVAAAWVSLPAWSCINPTSGVGEWALAGAGVTLAIIVLSASVHAGNRALHVLARLHESGVVSDISLAAGAGLVFIALLLGFAISMTGPFQTWLIGLLEVAWIGSTLGAYAWAVRRGAGPAPGRSLLILRVFARSKAAERLLDTVQARWRYVGPVYEIAGPDLARLNIDAFEVEKFVTSTLHEVFQLGAGDAQQLAARLDSAADGEGRFRVNEVFCLESAWRDTVGQLMRMSDAVVLDVRGFGPERRGTGFEVDLLARGGLLPRVLAVGDATTDWEYFDERIRHAGCSPGDAARMQATGKDAGDRIVQTLMHAAA